MKFLMNVTPDRHVMPLDIKYFPGTYAKGYIPDDYIDILYKDMDTGDKIVETIMCPKIEIWITKPEYRTYTHIRDTFPKEKCDRYYITYKNRYNEVANILGCNARDVKKSPYIFQFDMNIETFYLIQFINEYGNDLPKKISIGALDIENDICQTRGFPVYGETPIDVVSFSTDESMQAYQFIYTKDNLPMLPKEHPQHDYIEGLRKTFHETMHLLMEDPDILIKAMHELLDDAYGVYDYHIYFFDDEVELIGALFKIIEHENIDFLGAWNAPYDFSNLVERPKKFGYDPSSIIYSDKFDHSVPRKIKIKEDRQWQVQKRRHEFTMHVPYVVSDMMRNYAGVRAGRGKISSILKLGIVAQRELEDTKIDYSEYGNIKWFKYLDMIKYFLYNMKDTMLLIGMHRKTHDFDTVYSRIYEQKVLEPELFVSTRVIENTIRAFMYNYKDGFVMGSNKHRWEENNLIDYKAMVYAKYGIDLKSSLEEIAENFVMEEIEEDEQEEYNPQDYAIDTEHGDQKNVKFAGAFVQNTKHVESTGFMINGKESNTVHEDCVDEDITSEYPSGMEVMNASNETLVGKVFVVTPLDEKLPVYDIYDFVDEKEVKENAKIEFSSWVMEQYSAGDTTNLGEIAFGLPSVKDIVMGFKEFMEEV